MRRTTILFPAALVALSMSAYAAVPRKCIMEDGHVIYSYNKRCDNGSRDLIAGGTFSTVRNQSVRAVDVRIHTLFLPNMERGAMDPNAFGDH